MTIASEISRLQTAKANIEASIEGKGVTVPDDASLSDYPIYINMIEQATGLNGVKLYNNRVSGNDAAPNVGGLMSFTEDGKLYGCVGAVQEAGSSNNANPGFYTFRKIGSGDISYSYTLGSSYNGYYSPNRIERARYYTNGTQILCYEFIWYYPSTGSNYIMCYKAVWDYKTSNATGTVSRIGTSTSGSFNPEDYGQDLTGYTEIVGSTWVLSATGNEINDDAYIYLTLK